MWGARDPASLETFETMLTDDDPRVAGNAVMGLYRAGAEAEARAALTTLGAHPDARFRRAAAWVAGEIGGSETLLERLRGDSDPAVRVSALKSLVRMRRAVPRRVRTSPRRRNGNLSRKSDGVPSGKAPMFADLDLSKRLESAEGHACAQFADSRRRSFRTLAANGWSVPEHMRCSTPSTLP